MLAQSTQETLNYGNQLAAELRGGDVLCLYGELGAGKTTLVKGIAAGLGITDAITSPTFTLMNIYQFNASLHIPPLLGEGQREGYLIHIDTYRLKNARELEEIGALDYIGRPDAITVIEWPEQIEGLLKDKNIIKIFLAHQSENKRSIKLVTCNT